MNNLEEQIKAQQEDIKTLVAALRCRDLTISNLKEELEDSKNKNGGKLAVKDTVYHFDTPYFKIDAYGISCYAVLSYEETHWMDHGVYPYYRFHDVFGIYLDDRQFGTTRTGYGGRRSLSTPISYADLMRRLGKRVKSNHKGRGNDYLTVMDTVNKMIIKNKAWFGKFVETMPM